MQLYKIVIAATFGRGATSAFRAGLLRLGILWLAALSLGILFANGVPAIPLTETSTLSLALSGAFVVQTAVLLTLLASLGIVRPSRADTFVRLLLVLPLKPRVQWTALLLPGIMLTILALTLVGPVCCALLSHSGVPLLVALCSLAAGATSAFGMVYGVPRRYVPLQVMGVPAMLGLQYYLLRCLYDPLSNISPVLSAAALVCTFILPCLTLWLSRTAVVYELATPQQHAPVRAAFMPPWLWFGKKLWRSSITRIGCITALAMSSSIAVLYAQLHIVEPSLLAGVAALLTAAFAADIRVLAGRYNPAEIVALRGTPRFSVTEIGTGTLAGLIAVAPLLVVAMGLVTSLQEVGSILIQIVLGTSAGLFAGTLIVPGQRDITAQFAATLLAIAILAAPHLPLLSRLDTLPLPAIHLCLIIVLLSLAVSIEYKRNTYKWRKLHVR